MPREVRRLEAGWCLTMDRVSNGRPLARVLETGSAPSDLGEQLGRLIAQLVHLGMLHGDLHLDNLVVDAESKVWLVDFGQARTRDKRILLANREDLLALLGSLREVTDPDLRARLVATYVEFVGAESAGCELDELELAARRTRRRAVLGNLARWTRESGVAKQISVAGRSEILARRAPNAASTLVVESGDGAMRAWLTAARLSEHRVPTLAPVRLLVKPKLAAEFELPAGVFPLSEVRAKLTDEALAESMDALTGKLHDRGLQLDKLREADLYVGEANELFLHPRVQLKELDLHAAPPQPERDEAGTTATITREPLRRRLRARAWSSFSGLVRVLPESSIRLPLSVLARGARFASTESTVRANLELALGDETSRAERLQIAAGVRTHAARLVYEWARLGAGRSELAWLKQSVVVDDSIERLEELYARGQGVILVTAHIGNWELLAITLRERGFNGTVVGRQRANDSSSRFLVDMRSAWGLNSLPQDCSAREPLRVLQSGAILGLVTDMEVRRIDGEFLPFFNTPALCMTTPAAFARAAGLPLLPVRCVRPKNAPANAPYRLSIEEPLALDTSLSREAGRSDLTRRLNSVYERWIRETPEQWAWHQPRWRTRPGDRTIQPLVGHKQSSKSPPQPSPGELSKPN